MKELKKIIFIIHPMSGERLSKQPAPYKRFSGDEYVNDNVNYYDIRMPYI